MKLGEGVEWSVHCCTVLALLPPEVTLSAARLAEYHDVGRPYLAKHLQALSRAGIVVSVPGAAGGYRLAKPATEVSVLDVVLAVEGAEPAFRCTEIRQRGPAGIDDRAAYPKPCGIARAMWAAEDAWRAELARHTLADLAAGVGRDASPEAMSKGLVWFTKVLS